MILEPKKIHIAYRCKACASTIQGVTGAISLTGDLFKLKCPCGESELLLKTTNDDKIRVTIPCVFCMTNHTFIVSKSLLTSNKLFTYPCPYAGFDICFFGDEKQVNSAISNSDKQINDSLSEEELSKLRELENDSEEPGDVLVRSNILFVLDDLLDSHQVHCGCGTMGDYNITEGSNFVSIECKKCHKKRIYYCDDSFQTRELLDAYSITLQ